MFHRQQRQTPKRSNKYGQRRIKFVNLIRMFTFVTGLLLLGLLFHTFPMIKDLSTPNTKNHFRKQTRQNTNQFDENDSNSMSACLMIMDDNHFLVEWLAYHYHVANLRHLIVAVDPKSQTSPMSILKRWEGRMKIEVWTDEAKFIGNDTEKIAEAAMARSEMTNETLARSMFSIRQEQFYLECLSTLKNRKREWTFILDTDEFLHINPTLRESWDDLPSIREPGSVFTLLSQLPFPNKEFHIEHPCVPVARRQYSSREDEESRLIKRTFVSSQFHTLRWNYWGYKYYGHTILAGKSVLDLGRIKLVDIRNEYNTGNPHRPLGLMCPQSGIFTLEDKALLLANTYMGTREQWNFRAGDSRGAKCRSDKFDHRNNIIGKYKSNYVKEWIDGFIASVGMSEAIQLLHGVGDLEQKTRSRKKHDDNKSDVIEQSKKVVKLGDKVEVLNDDGKWNLGTIMGFDCRLYYDIWYGDEDWEWSVKLNEMRWPGTNYTIGTE